MIADAAPKLASRATMVMVWKVDESILIAKYFQSIGTVIVELWLSASMVSDVDPFWVLSSQRGSALVRRLQAPASGNMQAPKVHEHRSDCTLLCVSKFAQCTTIGHSSTCCKLVPGCERCGGDGVESVGGSLSHESLD